MSVFKTFEAVEATPLGSLIRESTWMFPVIEAGHLLSLALLGGSVLMLDLNLLGVGLQPHSAALVERRARPWLVAAATALIVTGVLLGISEAAKLYDRRAFWVKMIALAAALVFTFAIRMPVARRLGPGAVSGKLIAVVSIALWLTVAISGRWIGFS